MRVELLTDSDDGTPFARWSDGTDERLPIRRCDCRVDLSEYPEWPPPINMTVALDAAGLDGPLVDLALGAEEPDVGCWEAGTDGPTREQLRRLCRLTGVRCEWFYTHIPARMGTTFACGDRVCMVLPSEDEHPATRLVTAEDAVRRDRINELKAELAELRQPI